MISKPSPITRFQILNLHGDRDIKIDFDMPVKILVDENGSGKTTVLNTLFNVLEGNWFELYRAYFDSVIITFKNNEEICLNYTDFEQQIKSFTTPELIDLLNPFEKKRLFELVEFYSISRFGEDTLVKNISEKSGIPSHVLFDVIRRTPQKDGKNKHSLKKRFKEIKSKIEELFPYSILYFPDMYNLGYFEENFNMSDVERRFKKITSEIRDSSVDWHPKISGQILTQSMDGIDRETIDFDSLENTEVFRILLGRIGDNVDENHKEHLLKLIESGEIKKQKHEPLAYFLFNLIQVYEQQLDNDNAIKEFVRVSNNYLGDKEIRYNESKVNIKVVSRHSNQPVNLENLSSGEKQIISIFSKLYLDGIKPCAILFDEPELSLSMEWQKKLLQDIVKSGQCVFLLAATHSPFIFENELDEFASVIDIKFRDNNNNGSS